METTDEYVRVRVVPQRAAQIDEGIDPTELWLDQDIEPETMIEIDPLDISSEIVDQAEQPELADPVLRGLRCRSSSIWQEEAWLRKVGAQAKDNEAWRKLAQMMQGSR